MGLVLDLEPGRGLSLVEHASEYDFTVMATTVRGIGSGDRSMLGGKSPGAVVKRNSRAIQHLHAALWGVDPDMYSALGLRNFNTVFGTGTLKTGQAFIEQGIETLTTKMGGRTNRYVYEEQLEYLRNRGHLNNLADFEGLTRRLATFVGDEGMRKAMVNLANNIKGADVYSLVGKQLAHTANYLNANPEHVIGLGTSSEHVHAAALAFGKIGRAHV